MNGLLALIAAAFIVVIAAGLVRAQARAIATATTVTYDLRLPRELDAEAVQRFLTGICGLLPPWWRRWLVCPVVILETEGTAPGISHRIIVARAWSTAIEAQLRASLPGVRYEVIDFAPLSVTHAAEYRLSTNRRALRSDPTGTSAALLASLHPLEFGESIVVQWLLAPAAPVSAVRVERQPERGATRFSRAVNLVDSAEAGAAFRKKLAHPILNATARVGARAASPQRARSLVRQAEVAWHGSRAPGVHVHRRVLPQVVTRRALARRVTPFEWPMLVNVEELVGLLGWPVDTGPLPGVVQAGARQLAPSPLVPTNGTVVADSTYPGMTRPIALDLEARLRHVHVVGPTGTGKSVLLTNVIVSDLEAGYGVVVIDPKGDLVRDVLERVPEQRRDDVIVLDPADVERPVGLNPLRPGQGVSGEVVVENLVGLFHQLYGSAFGPRSTDIVRAALLTLVDVPGSSLVDVAPLLTDAGYRRRIVSQLADQIGLGEFWAWFEGLSDAERLSMTAAPLNKLRAFSVRPTVRGIIGQTRPALSMTDVLASGKVLLVSLASGLLGDEAASLLGALVVAELWFATKARAGLAASERRPVTVVLDEFQSFLALPTPMASVLAEARGLGLGLTLAHQDLSQLPAPVRAAILANARSRIIFQSPAADARLLARDFGELTAEDLQGLAAFEVVVSAFAAGATQPPVTGRTRPEPARTSDGAAIRAASRARYGVDRADVEAAITARFAPETPSAPIGRKPSGGAR